MLKKGELALIALETLATGVGGVCGWLFKIGVCKLFGVADEEALAETIEKIETKKHQEEVIDIVDTDNKKPKEKKK